MKNSALPENKNRIRVAVFGATGSVGGAALDICARFPEYFEVKALAARSNETKLRQLAMLHKPSIVCLTEPMTDNFEIDGCVCMRGEHGLLELASNPEIDNIVFASSGTSAIYALQKALECGKDVSLANKESIVVAGPWVMPLVKRADQLRPVDSEHSAIWQCLREDMPHSVEKIWLTASGGPFKDYSIEQMAAVSPEDALAHPVWKMGAKITIDSATLMNKGIECIEAMQLFNLAPDKVDALIHPKSQVHGMVLFEDGTMKMLLSHADMRLPAASALAWPKRLPLLQRGFDFIKPVDWDLSFREIDEKLFPCFKLACEAARMGGAAPSLLVGADEAAVELFLQRKIPFTAISQVVEEAISSWKGSAPTILDDAIALVEEGRKLAVSSLPKILNKKKI